MRKLIKVFSVIVLFFIAFAGVLGLMTLRFRKRLRSGKGSQMKNDRERLNNAFYKDSTGCYFRKTRIEGCDAASFEALDDQYARDQYAVFFCDSKISITGNVLPSFKTVVNIIRIAHVLSSEFKVLGYGYAKDGRRAYFEGMPFEVSDLPTLTAVQKYFACDDRRVYFKTQPVEESDGKTFQLLDDSAEGYARDSRYGYYFTVDGITRVLCNAATFEKIDGSYAKDMFAAYYDGIRLKNSDPETLHVLNHSYATDKSFVYCQHLIIEGADPVTFEILPGNEILNEDYYYTRDSTHVYWQDKKVKEADPLCFAVLEKGYGFDSRNVYYKMRILRDVNPKNFSVINGIATDGKTKFYEGKRLD